MGLHSLTPERFSIPERDKRAIANYSKYSPRALIRLKNGVLEVSEGGIGDWHIWTEAGLEKWGSDRWVKQYMHVLHPFSWDMVEIINEPT